MEYGLRAMELHLASMVEELRSLEGFTLTSLLARIKGDRDARVEETLRQAQALQGKLDAAVAVVDAMRKELGDAEPDLGEGGERRPSGDAAASTMQSESGPTDGDRAAAAPSGIDGRPTAAQRSGMIQRAIEMCDETRRGLLRQMEAAGSLDQCKTVAFNAVVSGMLGATTDRARKEMGQQTQSDLRRLLARFAEAVEGSSTPLNAEELQLRDTLTQFESKFDGKWFMPGHPGREALDELIQALSMAAIFLEKRLMDAKEGPAIK